LPTKTAPECRGLELNIAMHSRIPCTHAKRFLPRLSCLSTGACSRGGSAACAGTTAAHPALLLRLAVRRHFFASPCSPVQLFFPSRTPFSPLSSVYMYETYSFFQDLRQPVHESCCSLPPLLLSRSPAANLLPSPLSHVL
jgi:hypothetical protein